MTEPLTPPMKLALHGLSVLVLQGEQLLTAKRIIGDAAGMTISLSDVTYLGNLGFVQSKHPVLVDNWNTDTQIMLTLNGWKAAKSCHQEIEALWHRHKEKRWRDYYNKR